MSGLDLIFQLLTLLLGFSIAELLMGLARSWRLEVGATRTSQESLHIGWLVPLLALLVLIDQTHFWIGAYTLKQFFRFDDAQLLSIVFVIGSYYVISTFVFPDDPEQWPDHDDYYDASKRTVIGGIIAINLAVLIYGLWSALSSNYNIASAPAFRTRFTTGLVIGYLPCLIALWWIRSRKLNLVLLIAANALLLAEATAERVAHAAIS